MLSGFNQQWLDRMERLNAMYQSVCDTLQDIDELQNELITMAANSNTPDPWAAVDSYKSQVEAMEREIERLDQIEHRRKSIRLEVCNA